MYIQCSFTLFSLSGLSLLTFQFFSTNFSCFFFLATPTQNYRQKLSNSIDSFFWTIDISIIENFDYRPSLLNCLGVSSQLHYIRLRMAPK